MSPLPHFPPPNGFKEVRDVEWAEFRWEGPWGPGGRRRGYEGARAAGLAYERRVHRHFRSLYGPSSSNSLYAPGQWITFQQRGYSRRRWAQPDGLLLDFERGLVTIVEIKLRHTLSAWFWLRMIYGPLFRILFPRFHLAYLEVVRYYDPALSWPEPLRLVKYPEKLCEGQFGVHIWTGRI